MTDAIDHLGCQLDEHVLAEQDCTRAEIGGLRSMSGPGWGVERRSGGGLVRDVTD
jgi:hypothetical protein